MKSRLCVLMISRVDRLAAIGQILGRSWSSPLAVEPRFIGTFASLGNSKSARQWHYSAPYKLVIDLLLSMVQRSQQLLRRVFACARVRACMCALSKVTHLVWKSIFQFRLQPPFAYIIAIVNIALLAVVPWYRFNWFIVFWLLLLFFSARSPLFRNAFFFSLRFYHSAIILFGSRAHANVCGCTWARAAPRATHWTNGSDAPFAMCNIYAH